MKGYRGYVSSRPVLGNRVPQHIQNLVIRDFARKHGLHYKLSATEYALEGSYLILNQVITEEHQHDGIILYTMFMLPENSKSRRSIYESLVLNDMRLCCAVENLTLTTRKDIEKWERILLTQQICNKIEYAKLQHEIFSVHSN